MSHHQAQERRPGTREREESAIQRWAFVQTEILKNLVMGSRIFQSIRSSRTRYGAPKQTLDAAAEMCDFYEGQLLRLGAGQFLEGKRVLEIGPGASMIIPIWFLAKGARQADGIDRFMELVPPCELAVMHSLAVNSWPPEMRREVEDVLSWSAPGKNGDRLRYWNLPIEEASDDLAGSFSLVVSFKTMEHVYDVGAAIRSIYRLLAPGGAMIHRIDCGPHGKVGSFGAGVLNQLTFSSTLWRRMYSHRMGTNQEPMSAFVKECELAGFKDVQVEILQSITDEEVERLRPRLHPQYRNRSGTDLRAVSFALTATK